MRDSCAVYQSSEQVASNIVQQKKFSELFGNVVTCCQNHGIEAAQVMEERVFYDALASSEASSL